MRILNRKEAANRVDLSVSTLKRLETAGKFPRKLKITQFRVGYLESEVDGWITERAAKRNAETA